MAAPLFRNVSEILDRFLRLHHDGPDEPLVHLPVTGQTISRAGVWAEALAHRQRLQALGLGTDDLVLLSIGNHPSVFPIWLACRANEITIMPVDVSTTDTEIAELARRFGAAVAIVSNAAAERGALGVAEAFAPGLSAVRVVGAERRSGLCVGAAVLKLTSGSTGLPKVTFTTDAEMVLDTSHIVEAMGIRPTDTQIAAIPLSHAYGLGNLVISALVHGTPIVLREGFVPHMLPGDARRYGARVFPGVPYMFEHLIGAPPAGGWPPSLRTLVSAGARLEPGTVKRFSDAFGVKVHSFYGTSETGGIAYDDTDEVMDEPTVGRTMPGVIVTLRPEDGAPVGGGRVHVAGDAVAARYAGEAPDTEPFIGGGFLTGDLGFMTPRSHLVLTGRASAFINVAGRKVQPEEVEQVLRALPSIDDVRVIGAPDEARGQQIVACLVSTDRTRSVLTVRQFCAGRLAPYKVPRAVVWLDSIPLTERGKTDRGRLEALVRERLAQDRA